jgi:hypothetical protein
MTDVLEGIKKMTAILEKNKYLYGDGTMITNTPTNNRADFSELFKDFVTWQPVGWEAVTDGYREKDPVKWIREDSKGPASSYELEEIEGCLIFEEVEKLSKSLSEKLNPTLRSPTKLQLISRKNHKVGLVVDLFNGENTIQMFAFTDSWIEGLFLLFPFWLNENCVYSQYKTNSLVWAIPAEKETVLIFKEPGDRPFQRLNDNYDKIKLTINDLKDLYFSSQRRRVKMNLEKNR